MWSFFFQNGPWRFAPSLPMLDVCSRGLTIHGTQLWKKRGASTFLGGLTDARVLLRLAQDPNSQHLGSTVWDASIVLAKYFEKNSRKGEWARNRVCGKKALELGAGMGLGGMALALLGVDVVSTDVEAVMPLLQLNYSNNMSPSSLRNMCGDLASRAGSMTVLELDWQKPETWANVQGPFDYVLAADCVYNEDLVHDLLKVVLLHCGPKTTVVIANELRSESVQQRFNDTFSDHFVIKRVPMAKLDAVHQHPAIQILLLKRRKNKEEKVSTAGHHDSPAKEMGCLPST